MGPFWKQLFAKNVSDKADGKMESSQSRNDTTGAIMTLL